MRPEDRLLLEAISLASRAHQGQQRKDQQTPYIAHPLRVMTIMAVLFGVKDPQALAVAALHDTLEDTTTDRDDLIEQFGQQIAAQVAALSKDQRLPEEERERQYLEQLSAGSEEVKLCKVADLLDNLTDMEGLSPQGRLKKVVHARQILSHFETSLAPRWKLALDLLRERVREVEAELQEREGPES